MSKKGIFGIAALIIGALFQGVGILLNVQDTTEKQLEPTLEDIRKELELD